MTTSTNARQVGGDHYASEYQHWDFVCDTNMHYLLGCATKYVSRWRKKGGKEDLKKAIHYLEKYMEVQPIRFAFNEHDVDRFCATLHPDDAGVIRSIMATNYEDAIDDIDWILDTN